MNTTTKFAGFGLGLAAVFGLALGIGTLAGPESGEASERHQQPEPESDTHGHEAAPGGLTATAQGYTLELDDTRTTAAEEYSLSFRILDPTGAPLTSYETVHDKDLHLVVTHRDLTTFEHLHPELAADGTWKTTLDVARAGDYRIFAEFAPAGGSGLTLGADLRVAGDYEPEPLPEPSRTATTGDYTVELAGDLVAGAGSEVTLTVSEDGEPVTDLQPYLGAYGHLVALRASDLGYLHVHPMGEPGDGSTAPGPEIPFHLTVPTSGDYRLFLNFQHDGRVHTADFTVAAAGAGAATAPAAGHAGHGN